MSKRNLARALIVAGALLFSYAFFYQAGGWNQNSRLDLARAIVEQRSLRIDEYRENTGDLALIDGHYYSDKAPGLAFLAVPPVAASRPVLDAVGIDTVSFEAQTFLSYVATVVAVGVPTALAALAIYWLALRFGASSAAAAFAAVAFGLATPMWAYATLLWGHAVAGALLVGGFAGTVALRDAGSSRRDVVLGALVGLAVGWATVTEFTAAIPAALIVALAARHVWTREPARRSRILAAVAAGAVLCGLVLVVYNVLAFGSPFEFGYTHTVNFPEMGEGLFGVSAPDPYVAAESLFGLHRGLVPLAPVLVAAPIGFYLLAKDRDVRPSVVVAGAIVVYYLLLMAGYNNWEGGWTYGPRFLAPALPFLCFPLAAVWTRARAIGHVLLAGLLLWGAGLSLVAVATTAQPPAYMDDATAELLWPAFRDGNLSLNTVAVHVDDEIMRPELVKKSSKRDAFNLGERVGLSGHVSLLPLLAVWALAAAAWWQLGRRRSRDGMPAAPAITVQRAPDPRAMPSRAAPPVPRAGGP